MRKPSRYLIWIAILLLVSGFFYDIMFAGIPYQDAPESLIVQYNRHQTISERIMIAGLVVTGLGVILRFVRRPSSSK